MDDKTITTDVLASHKFVAGLYAHNTLEAAAPSLRQDFAQLFQQEQENANRLFQVMHQKGWYQIHPASQQQLSQAQQKYQQMPSTGPRA